ncbi:MAG: hybrid sensor histidine kinase/response regulator [Anaerolineales bacterium]|nr:hybrid sensor histidine kinase/response regulator [Anaerolineales bacterium]
MTIDILTFHVDPIQVADLSWTVAEHAEDVITEAPHYQAVLLEASAIDLIQAVSELGVPVVALCEADQRQTAFAAGATDVVSTPLDKTELMLRLQKLHAVDLTGALDSVTHDLFNPLGITAYSLDLALEIMDETGEAQPEMMQLIRNVLSANERLHFMIEDMMDYFRLYSNRLLITNETLDVAKIIRRAADRMEKIATPNNISIKTDLPDTLPALYNDKNLLRRVIVAALDTSIKFCQPHSVIHVTSYEKDNGVSIVITDPGQPVQAGFRPEQLFSLAVTSAAREAGSRSAVSFSLPFCALAIQRMGGTIAMVSEQGTTHLTLWLPLEA